MGKIVIISILSKYESECKKKFTKWPVGKWIIWKFLFSTKFSSSPWCRCTTTWRPSATRWSTLASTRAAGTTWASSSSLSLQPLRFDTSVVHFWDVLLRAGYRIFVSHLLILRSTLPPRKLKRTWMQVWRRGWELILHSSIIFVLISFLWLGYWNNCEPWQRNWASDGSPGIFFSPGKFSPHMTRDTHTYQY